MERSYALIRGGTVFVHAYYDLSEGGFVEVPAWDEQEKNGEPAYIALAERDGPNKWKLTRDLQAGPVYPHQNILTGWDPDVTHERLHEIAGGMGCRSSFGREVWLFTGGSDCWKAALQASPVEKTIWDTAADPRYARGLIEKAGGEVEMVFDHEILFWLDESDMV